VKSPDLFSRAGSLRLPSRLEHKRHFGSAQEYANGAPAVDRRMIDIFISAPPDVQKEHCVAEQLIRSAAAEFSLPINVWYSNPLRRSGAKNSRVEHDESSDQSTPVVCPHFWEYPEQEESDFLEIPNPGLYDLVVCILWSRLGTIPAPQCVMPDGSRPKSATDYEVAWALHQSKQTPGCPGLHVYRSRATPVAPLEPRKQRENLCRQWDAVEEFYAAWEKDAGTGFRECCHDFQDLEEFEGLFRNHFREFLARRLDATSASGNTSRKVLHPGSNPFRGLDFFDFEHSAVFQGRTRALGEVFDVLKTQAAAKKPFLLVVGPTGSGKSSFVRAGVLPLMTRGATPAGAGPWRRALTRPGATGDPFDAIVDALLAQSALPELRSAISREEPRDLASQLRKDPDEAAARIRKVMDQLAEPESDHLLADRKEEGPPAPGNENLQIAIPTSLATVKPMTRLVLVVDQLEELFTHFSPVIQQKYIAALCALANWEHVFLIATLRSDFSPHYRQCSGLAALGGRYELQPPTPRGIGNIIRFRTEAAGLRFEQNPETNRSLDETIVQAAVASPESLPLLEHLLSLLYERQLARKDGLLLWADYRATGGFHHALAQHAEFLFLKLKSDEQEALKFVFRHLLVPSRTEEGFLNRRSVPYRDLVLHPRLNQQRRAGVKGLVDRFIKEGLLSAKTDSQQERFISIPQEALLRRWPRLWELLSADQRFLRMRERLDASMNPWITHGRPREDLLDRGIDLVEGQTLLTDFGSRLNETEIEYIKKSLARHRPPRKVPQKIGAVAIAALGVVGAFVGGERFNAASQRTDKEQHTPLSQQNTDVDARERSKLEAERGALELRLKESEQKLQIAQQTADLAVSLGTQLKKTQEEKAQLAQQNADLTDTQRAASEADQKKTQQEKTELAQQNTNLVNGQNSEQEAQRNLETQLKDSQDKLQLAQKNADLANTRQAALEADLKKAQREKAQLIQQNTDLANSQNSAQESRRNLETQLKDSQDKLQLAQKNADLANTQRAASEADLKKAQDEKGGLAQQNSNLAGAQSSEQEARRDLETQLKDLQDKLQLAQKNTDLANTQRTALEADLKKAQQEKAQLTQQNTNLANGQNSERAARRNLETQLKDSQDKLQFAQKNADLANTQRAASEADLKKAQEEKAGLALQNSNLADAQSSEQVSRRNLETQLKDAQDKLQLAQKNADFADTQRSALDNQLKNEQVKLEQAQAEADRANTELSEMQTQLKQEQEATAQKVKATTDLYTWLNQHHEASPAPTPAATDDSGASNPPESQSPYAKLPAEKESLRKFVLGYIGAVASNNTSTQRRYLADRVNFYGKGILDSADVDAATKLNHDKWPVRKWEPYGEAKVVRLKTSNLFAVAQPFTWTAADGSHYRAHGNATLYLRVRRNSKGDFQIVYIRQYQH
jgi:conflict system STAND superfamily ATPase